MGISLAMNPHLLRLMSAEDQVRYGAVSATAPRLDLQPLPRAGTAERKEQASFANWLLLQNSKGRRIPFSWHATHTRSKATPGTPDFWVGISRNAMWIEFKRDHSCELSPEQEDFRLACEAQHNEHRIAYSAQQAIELVQKTDTRVRDDVT
jgi:hypothetical protein